jgi:hypothetical protein
MKITPAWASFFKTLGIVVALAILGFLSDAANLEPVFGVTGSALVVAIVSAIEAKIKAATGSAFFGAVKVR